MDHNYWTCALEPTNHNYESPLPQPQEPMCPTARAPQEEKPSQWEAWASQLEKPPGSPQLEKATKTQYSQKINKENILKKKTKVNHHN